MLMLIFVCGGAVGRMSFGGGVDVDVMVGSALVPAMRVGCVGLFFLFCLFFFGRFCCFIWW